jgi:hypothetical protein
VALKGSISPCEGGREGGPRLGGREAAAGGREMQVVESRSGCGRGYVQLRPVESWILNRCLVQIDENNVVAVHCKAGKGRTGLVIVCYLMFGGLQLRAGMVSGA